MRRDGRKSILAVVADAILEVNAVRVGVDGIDAAGKTVFAGDLAAALRAKGREAVRVSIDGFHHPRVVRYRRGRSSPEGYWLDSYDYARFRADVLDPFGPEGDRRYRRAARDVRTDRPVDAAVETATDGAVLVVDGIFVHRDELVGYWDYSVFLRVGFDVAYARMAERDGLVADPDAPSNRRYVEGQRIYLATCDPERRADLVIDNTDPVAPRVVAPVRSASHRTDA